MAGISIYDYLNNYNNNINKGYNGAGASGTAKAGYNNVYGNYNYANKNKNLFDAVSSKFKQMSASLKLNADSLTNSASSKSVFKKTAPLADNKAAMDVRTESNSTAKSNFTATVDIKQVATAQKNVSEAMNSNASYSGRTGTNYLAVSVGGKSYNIGVNVKSTDTNKSVMQNVANAINEKNIGVKASVKVDSATKKSSLVIEGAKTGENNGFSINDVGNYGSIVKNLSLDNVVTNAQNAMYSVNGKPEVNSASNVVDLGNGITGVLKATSENPVKVSMQTDVSTIKDKITSFVKDYNNLLDSAYKNSGNKNSSRLASQLSSAAKSYSNTLSKAGLSVSKDGYISVDDRKLSSAVESGIAEKSLSSSGFFSGGFSNRVSRIAGDTYKSAQKFASASSQMAQDSSSIESFLNDYYKNGASMNTTLANNMFGGANGSLFDIML